MRLKSISVCVSFALLFFFVLQRCAGMWLAMLLLISVFMFLSCAVHKAEASGPSAVIR